MVLFAQEQNFSAPFVRILSEIEKRDHIFDKFAPGLNVKTIKSNATKFVGLRLSFPCKISFISKLLATIFRSTRPVKNVFEKK